MADSPLMVVTDAGLAAASVATPTGPYVHITGFRIGSAYGYTPQKTDTDLNGTLLFQGVPSSYEYAGDNTINVICVIPGDAGPFDFGEVAVDLDGPVMFAKAAFAAPLHKYSSLGTNLLSTYTFNCLLKLTQPVAIFKVNTASGVPPTLWEVDFWSDVYPPALSANPLIPLILVKELDQNGNSSLLHNADDQHWTLGTNYNFLAQPLVAGGTVNYLDISKNDLTPTIVSSIDRQYVVEFSNGYMRSVLSVVDTGSVYRFTFNPQPLPVSPVTGSPVSIWSNIAINQQPVPQTAYYLTTIGAFSFTVPAGVYKLWITGTGPGGGGGGAAGTDTSKPPPSGVDGPWRGGGGGGGGGHGQDILNFEMDVTPGQVINGFISPTVPGGTGGLPGQPGTQGGTGVPTTFGTLSLAAGIGGNPGTVAPPSGGIGAEPGGCDGIDGTFGGAGGKGADSVFGIGGKAPRGSTSEVSAAIDGGDADGAGAAGAGGATVYADAGQGGNGGKGAQGYLAISWNNVYSNQ